MREPEIVEGRTPGRLGWCVAEHARHSAGAAAFGLAFEREVAAEMAAVLGRFDPPRVACIRAEDAAGLLGTVSLDGGKLSGGHGAFALVHRVGARAAGGLGRRLLARAVIAGLQAARRLHEDAGLRLVREADGGTRGIRVRGRSVELGFWAGPHPAPPGARPPAHPALPEGPDADRAGRLRQGGGGAALRRMQGAGWPAGAPCGGGAPRPGRPGISAGRGA